MRKNYLNQLQKQLETSETLLGESEATPAAIEDIRKVSELLLKILQLTHKNFQQSNRSNEEKDRAKYILKIRLQKKWY